MLAKLPPKIKDMTADILIFVSFTGAICKDMRLMFMLMGLQTEGNEIVSADITVWSEERYLPLSGITRANNLS
jgi:hypothetical protein